MAELRHSPQALTIRRLLRMEHGVRKAARILLFFERRELIEILCDLPHGLLAALAREMAKLKSQIHDFESERQRLIQEIGGLAEVIDLRPVNVDGSAAFAFLRELTKGQCETLMAELGPEIQAQLIANAPLESVLHLVQGVTSRAEKMRLVEDMTRLRTVASIDVEAIRSLAQSICAEKQRKRSRRHGKQGTQQKGRHASSVGESINEVVNSIGLPGLQSCLASLALEVIVGAWPRLSEPEREVLQQQISRNRRESLETALQVREEDFGDGRRQEALLIEHLLRAARLEV